MFLIVGLGNPGKEYAQTRHNLGFMLVDKLAAEAGISVKPRDCQSWAGSGLIENQYIKLVKPQTFMNRSGEAVECMVAKLAGDARYHLLVISDDLALPFGAIRLRQRGSAGGHNGLKSIIASLGTNEFTRLRIGIQPEHPISDSKKFVLSEFSREEKRALDEILERSARAVRSVISDGIAKAMSLFNSEGQRAKGNGQDGENT